MKGAIGFLVALGVLTGCVGSGADSSPEAAPDDVDVAVQGLSDPTARRARSEAIRDVAAGEGLTNGALLAGIAQVETGLSHCWSEATWACQGLDSPSCGGGPVIAGAADGPCSAQQGGLGMFQFDGGTYADTIARDGEAILLLEGNITHAVEFVAERVRQDIPGVDSIPEAIAWINAVPVAAGDPVFEQWIELVSCRYNGCCGCSSQEAKYRDATIAARDEFEPGFWDASSELPTCEPIPAATTVVLEEDDACALAGGAYQYWREVTTAGHGGRLLWTHTTDSATTENYGQWNLDLAEGGVYRLEVATDGGTYAESTQAAYRIHHNGGDTVVVIDQSAVDGFQALGDFKFAAGADQWIRFDDNTGEPLSTETRIAFDALRVTPVVDGDPDDPDDPGNPDDDLPGDSLGDPDDDRGAGEVSGGCNTAGTGAAPWPPLVILACVFGPRVRRRARL